MCHCLIHCILTTLLSGLIKPSSLNTFRNCRYLRKIQTSVLFHDHASLLKTFRKGECLRFFCYDSNDAYDSSSAQILPSLKTSRNQRNRTKLVRISHPLTLDALKRAKLKKKFQKLNNSPHIRRHKNAKT